MSSFKAMKRKLLNKLKLQVTLSFLVLATCDEDEELTTEMIHNCLDIEIGEHAE